MSRIDLFQQIKAFDYLCLTDLHGITGNYRSVYFALLSINNSKYWCPVFEVDFEYVTDLSCVDKDTYRRAMNFFNEKGLFDSYEKGVNKYSRAKVSLKVLTDFPTGNTSGNTTSSGDVTPPAYAPPDKEPTAHFYKTETITNTEYEQTEYARDAVFENSVLKFFGFNEIANYDKTKLVSEFCLALNNSNQLENFKKNFAAYVELKTLTGYKHSFAKFLGNQSECFMDGKWNAENWEQKLDEEKAKITGSPHKEKSGGRISGIAIAFQSALDKKHGRSTGDSPPGGYGKP